MIRERHGRLESPFTKLCEQSFTITQPNWITKMPAQIKDENREQSKPESKIIK